MSSGVIEEIKSKLDIVQIVSEHVPLKKAGSAWRACCPFHGEKTPSFYVNVDRQRYHCFGCGEDGDIFGFIQRMEGVEFPEALRILAKRAGVELKPEDAAANKERTRLQEANRLAARFWHEVLLKHPVAEKIRAYAATRRALKQETLEDWLIGYAPDTWDALLNALKRKGFSEEELFKAGLVSRSERGTGHFDRFRNRLMFPIRDVHGNIVGFTGRIIPGADGKDPEGEAKYVNTNQTLIYNKSHLLFGLDRAKQEIRKQGLAVIVEGNMDVVSVQQAGFLNVVASSGTALTDEQLRLLKRFTSRIVLSFDNDKAGETAARRGIDAAAAQEFAIRVLRLPPDAGKDPDDCVRKNPELWHKAVADAVPYMEWYLELAKARTDFHDPEAKKEASHQLLAEISKMKEPVEQSHWIREMARLFDTPDSLLFERLQKLKTHIQPHRPQAPSSEPPHLRASEPVQMPKPTNRSELVSEFVLAMLYRWPAYAETVISRAMPEDFEDHYRRLYTEYVVAYTAKRHGGSSGAPSLPVPDPATESAQQAAILELRAEKEFGDLEPEKRQDALERLIGELQKLRIDRRKKELIQEMSRAEKDGDQVSIQEIQRQLDRLHQ